MSTQGTTDTAQRVVWIGVDIGGTKTAVVLADHPPAMLSRVEFPTLPEEGPDRVVKLIKETIHTALRKQGIERSNIRGIGVSCGGPLDRIRGVIQSPPNLPTWDEVPITSILSREFGVDCRLENDADAGAVAEHRFGAGRGISNMVFLTMGTGLGAGIILENNLFRGATGHAGEIGHVRLTAVGPVGYNKAGSVEGWASGDGMAQVARARVEEALRKNESTTLSHVLQQTGHITAKDVAGAARTGDVIAFELVRSTGNRLGEALAILVDILNPERIVIGGLALRFGEMLLEPARATLQQEALSGSVCTCQIVPAFLGEAIGDVAAICIAQECESQPSH